MGCSSMYAGAVTAWEIGVVIGEEREGYRTARSLRSATYSARNPSSPSTPAGIFPTSPSEIEVCSKHLNLAENVLMHSH